MREFLITKFVCAKCGNNLELNVCVPNGAGGHIEGEPSGAYMVEKLVAIEPCKTCMKPLHEMRSAVKNLLNAVSTF